MRIVDGVRSLRRPKCYRVVKEALRAGCEREGFRLVHFSVQSNHLHLICEADGKAQLSNGVRGLAVRIARRLNPVLGRKGRLFASRYHAHHLATPREVRHALCYVLQNGRRHRVAPLRDTHGWDAIDPCSSASWFRGYWPMPRTREGGTPPVAKAKTWLLTRGWQRHGFIHPGERPGPVRRKGVKPG